MSSPSREELLDRLVREGHLLSSRLVVSHQGRADALGLGPTDLLCLELIGGEGETTAGRLAELLQLTTGAVTGVLDRLERSGYVHRERDTGDRRRVLVRISPERQRHLAGLLDPLAAALDEVAEPWSTDELRFAVDFLERLHPALAAESARLRPDGGDSAGAGTASAQTLPGGGLRQARLDVPEGLYNFTIGADPSLPELVSTSFKGRPPSLELDGNTVTMRLKRQSIFRGWTGSGHLTLSGAVRWDIDLRGGVYRLNADLRKLDLAGLVVSGGVHRMDVSLPAPKGTVSISISGGASSLSLDRPAGSALRVNVEGGAYNLKMDSMEFGSVSGPTRWQTPDFDAAPDRYDFSLEGGAYRLALTSRES